MSSHLSRPCVSAGFRPPFGTDRANHGPCRRCFGWGLHGTLDYPRVGGLLPRLSILTLLCKAVYFCCTFPRVASAGISPAPCPVKLGLSSLTPERPRDCLAFSQNYYIILSAACQVTPLFIYNRIFYKREYVKKSFHAAAPEALKFCPGMFRKEIKVQSHPFLVRKHIFMQL